MTRTQISHEDWRAKGHALFGPDQKQWRFKCPNCGTIQTVQDFLDLPMFKSNPSNAQGYIAFSCIGRFVEGKGCNWTLGGLFQIHKTEVLMKGAPPRRVFEFDEPDPTATPETLEP